jgi:hypothetical protein
LAVSATSNVQNLYINGTLVDSATATAVAISADTLYIGRAPTAGSGCTTTLINTVFYTADLLTQAEIQTMYTWLGAYGRLPQSGVIAAGWDIDHFWDLFDNKDAIQTTWASRGAVGAKALTRAGTCSIASTGTAQWGW